MSDYAELNSADSDQQQREKAKRYADVAKTLIIRLQDAIDDEEIGILNGSPA